MSKRTFLRISADAVVIFVIVSLTGAALVSAALMPNETARRTKCMSQLREIGMAFIMWENDHQGFPPAVDAARAAQEPARARFAWLLKEGYLQNARILLCPSARKDTAAPDFPKDLKNAKVSELVPGGRNCSYGLDPDKTLEAQAGCALISDKPQEQGRDQDSNVSSDNHGQEGQNVFYRDGHVKWSRTVRSDSGEDENIFAGDPKNNSPIDANIDP